MHQSVDAPPQIKASALVRDPLAFACKVYFKAAAALLGVFPVLTLAPFPCSERHRAADRQRQVRGHRRLHLHRQKRGGGGRRHLLALRGGLGQEDP